MKIRFIDPVPGLSTEEETYIRNYLKGSLKEDTELEFVPVIQGFPCIETEAQGIMNGAEILKVVIDAQNSDCDGIFINCFDDPALLGARELSNIPVLGPYGASVHLASLLSEKFGIITTDDYGLTCEGRKARHYGVENAIASIEKVDMTVLDVLDFQESNLLEHLVECCKRFEKNQVYAVVLGCTGMNFVADALNEELKKQNCPVQVIEPQKAGLKMLEMMIELGFSNIIHSTEIKPEEYIQV